MQTIDDFRAQVTLAALTPDYDPNDYIWKDLPWLEVLPEVDLAAWALSIEDQLQQGSCVSNSLTTVCELVRNIIQGNAVQLSRDYHYWRGRAIDPVTAPPKDGGMTLKQGLQAGKAWGICREVTRPYSMATFNDAPTPEQDAEAAQHRITRYECLKNDRYQDSAVTLRRIKEALTLGYPVQVGMVLEEAFFSLKGPCNGRPYAYGGMAVQGAVSPGAHAMALPGYCQRGALDWHKYLNSWGTVWGDQGTALLPMMIAAGSDCFDVRAVTEFDGVSLGEPATIQAHDRIARLYVAMFGRAPDTVGLTYWTGVLNSGVALTDIAAQMYAVDPARAYYPTTLTPEQVAAAFYVNVLGRVPSADVLTYWGAQVRTAGAGPAIQAMLYATAFYMGTDGLAVAASDRFNRRVRVARMYAEAGGTVEGATAVIQYVS